ncbi:LysE/ArgO family amino acid transporter [Mesobacillus selenatarsenatis]|uniref:Transporter, LysE family n=1 Tax=Mesobacillus selenatarsenatis (strain DSM 18680 / JCM 14380 / FERM P-15431 / SF-1) TaxID=1321606 RepID=A0A0A8X786_MESS1|nr:LysE/ArgO family amino acid transporter [Mesobacillus selenatarsenatis]GAM13991.1 transporter, LysE family [Mesobacillus selenatarsenatis SF-1]
MLAAGIHGLILAFGLILPLGVQNVFVFNQGSMHKKYRRVLPVILTASISDTLLITLAVLGISVIVLQVAWLKTLLLSAGILFLIYMGYLSWKSTTSEISAQQEAFSPKKQITFAASVSLLNPHAIMDTIGVIGTSSLNYAGPAKIIFALACILTSWIWFFALAFVGRQVGRLGKSNGFLIIMNKVSAMIIWGTAIYLAVLLFNR